MKHADIFCRVIDNYGDIGICWRLAKQLQSRGLTVRLWTDLASHLAWMQPDWADSGIDVQAWPDDATDLPANLQLGDLIIEAFGCELPQVIQAQIAQQTHAAHAANQTAPVWINLEYLSAESFAARCHRLPSPVMTGAAKGLTKWFFYPGFTAETGGLLREADLQQQQAQFDRSAWLQHVLQPLGTSWQGQRIVTLFCYDFESILQDAAPRMAEAAFRPSILNSLLQQLTNEPTLLLIAHGKAQNAMRTVTKQAEASIATAKNIPWHQHPHLTPVALPALPQADFDHLLWASDLNLVRGEDSLTRAIWAGKPFVWQIYPQIDNAHHAKLAAFLNMAAQQTDRDIQHWQAVHHAWNGIPPNTALPTLDWPDLADQASRLRTALWLQEDLVAQLLGFVLTAHSNNATQG